MEDPNVFSCSLELTWGVFLNSSSLAFLGYLQENLCRPIVYNPGLFYTPGLYLAMTEDTSVVRSWVREVQLVSGGQSPDILLNTLQYTVIWPRMSIAPSLRRSSRNISIGVGISTWVLFQVTLGIMSMNVNTSLNEHFIVNEY